MYIIKISPVSFKIVLSKDDLKRHGVENILNHPSACADFFADIIDETNRLYGAPFSEGAVDAEFFESKEGGGELFLSKSKRDGATYHFKTKHLDSLICLCKRLSQNRPPSDSKLFFGDDCYSLVLFYSQSERLVMSILKEYGKASEINQFGHWLLEEHKKVLIAQNAVEQINNKFL